MEQVLQLAQVPAEAAAEFSNVTLPFTLRPHQITSLQGVLAWDRMGLFDEPRCLPGDTEFLTPTGWRRIDEYRQGDLVGQVDPDTKKVSYVVPERYIQSTADNLVTFKSRKGQSTLMDYSVTEDHSLLYYTKTYHRDGRVSETPGKASPEEFLQGGNLVRRGFANTFSYSGPGLPLTEAEVRVMAAVIADGYFPKHYAAGNRTVFVRIKKARKKQRLEELLQAAGIPYSARGVLPEGFQLFSFEAPRKEKEFSRDWWSCSADQLATVVEEAEHWDGCRQSVKGSGKKTAYQFSTGSKASADFLQYAAAATGRTASLSGKLRVREGRKSSMEYVVTVRDKKGEGEGASLYHVKRKNVSVERNPQAGNRVYCFTVQTGAFVIRQKGRIYLTGNCGKTIVMHLASIYLGSYGYKTVFLLPPAMIYQFETELNRIGNHGLAVHCLVQGPAQRRKYLSDVTEKRKRCDVLLMSKEIFKTELADLILAGFNVLMFDEAHMGLQSEAMWTKKKARTIYASVQYFIENTVDGRLVLSTGSPILNDLGGTYPIISLKSPEAYQSRREFDYVHTTFKQLTIKTPRGPKTIRVADPLKYRNLEELNKNLYHQSVRALKLEVLGLDVPNIQEINVKLHGPHLNLYRRVLKDKVIEVGGELIDARQQTKLRALALQLITDPGVASDTPPKNAVYDTVQSLIESVNISKTKVVLFANFNSSVEKLFYVFKKYNPVTVYGPNGSEINRQNVNHFQKVDDCRLLIANPVSGGVGLTLGGVSQTVIFVEPVSTPGQFDQAASRVILAGQTEPVSIYVLRISNTISPKATDLMLGKAKLTKQTLCDSKTMLDELLG